MIALPKLLLLVLIGVAAWYVYRRVVGPPRTVAYRRTAPPQAPVSGQAEDLVACTVCGAYVAATARSCGRPDCPHPR
jgi:hypothetical protein